MNTMRRLPMLAMLMLLVSGVAIAQTLDRAQRAEIRFLQGMIDHHQMALDMAVDCLERASTEEVRAICESVIAAQTPEIKQMQAWLLDWYNISYTPMSMTTAGSGTTSDAGIVANEGPGMHQNRMRSMGGMMGQGRMMGQGGMMGRGGMTRRAEAQPAADPQSGHSDHGAAPPAQDPQSGHGDHGATPPAQDPPQAGHGDHGATPPAQDPPQTGHGSGGILPFTDPPMTMGMMAGLNRYRGPDYDIAWLEAMIDHHDDALHMAERILGRVVHAELETLAKAIIAEQSAEMELMEALVVTIEARR